MNYNLAAHPTEYQEVMFRSRLEARWAAFFDLAGWKWEYEPCDLKGWIPDFRVEFPCSHSECNGSHILLVEVKPYFYLKQFNGHPCCDYPYGGIDERGKATIPADASAAFGANTEITYWEMAHGSGGGEETLSNWVNQYRPPYKDADILWKKAGYITRYIPNRNRI